jgi:DNA polymerase-3 subunit gamma/tau
MSYLVLARKWRPQAFEDLSGQEPIARILSNAILQDKVAHAYIFSGPRGVGKTSSARILAKSLNCVDGPTPEPCGKCPSCIAISDGSSVDVSEIDGASNTGVDNIRDLRERIRYAPSGGKYKVYIIDEAHMLSTSAFNALLKTLEEPPAHVIFVLATTEPRKIPQTVLSRCQHLPFRRMTAQKIKERLKVITSAEGIKITDQALDIIARAADGSMRDSLTLLDQIFSFSEDISASDVKDLLGLTDVETLAALTIAVIEGDRKGIINIISELTAVGTDLKSFTKDLLQFVRNLLIASVVDDSEGILDLADEESAAIARITKVTSEEHTALLLFELIKAEPTVRSAFYPRIALEMSLIRLSLLSHLGSVNEALKAIQGKGQDLPLQCPAIEVPDKEPEKPTIVRKSLPKDSEILVSKEKKAKPRAAVQGIEAVSLEVPPIVTMGKADNDVTAVKISQTIPVYDSLEALWEAALDKADPRISSHFSGVHPSFSDNLITLVSDNDTHGDFALKEIPQIKDIIKLLSGRNISINVEVVNKKVESKRDLIEKAKKDPIVAGALELFDGRIVDVIPADNKGGENV